MRRAWDTLTDRFGRNTLSLYFARKFTINLGVGFAACLGLIFLADMVENLRRAGQHDVDFDTVLLLSIYHLPSLSELALPFAVLFSAMATFLLLSKSLELVVARSAGISAWQFIGPAIVVALLVGVAATTLYNPLAADFRARHQALFAESFGWGGQSLLGSSEQAWLRQKGADGPSVLHARSSDGQGLNLRQVTVWMFSDDNVFHERIEAERATLEEGRWRLNDVWIVRPDQSPAFHHTYLLSTYLSATQVQENLAAAEAISFWSLPDYISIAEHAGLPAVPYRLQYQNLLARPLLLCAMVLIAATVSLRLFRLGNIGPLVLAGIVAGFVLYVVSKLAIDLGKAGAIAPFVAAWAPAIVAALVGTTIMLYQEDG